MVGGKEEEGKKRRERRGGKEEEDESGRVVGNDCEVDVGRKGLMEYVIVWGMRVEVRWEFGEGWIV